MRNMVFMLTVLILLISCNEEDGIDNSPKTLIVFDNTQGISYVTVYEDPRRRDIDIITRVPAGKISQEIEYMPSSSMPFYFTYHVGLREISDFTFDFRPELGRDQTEVRIDLDVTTNIIIRKLEDAVSSHDQLLSNDSFIIFQNNSTSSFRLQHGSSSITPDNLSSPVVMPGEMAHYRRTPGEVSPYHLFIGGQEVRFPDSLINFKAGYAYIFTYVNSGISLIHEIELTLRNVLVVPGTTFANKLLWLQTNAQNGETYYVSINEDEIIPRHVLSFSNQNVTIILYNNAAMRTVSPNAHHTGDLFTIESGVTLILDNNITLQGRQHSRFGDDYVVVRVNNGGALIMNNNSRIIENGQSSIRISSGGRFIMNGDNILNTVFINDGGIFTMNGGKVTGGSGIINSGVFTMNGGEISGNRGNTSAGVHNSGGIFNMRGGIISNNTATNYNWFIVVSGGVVNRNDAIFRISNGIVYGRNAEVGLSNQSERGGAAALFNSEGVAQHGIFNNDDTFVPFGNLETTNDTIHVVDGVLQR